MLRCDFCGREFETLQRVALDAGYDRLTVRHDKKYAYSECLRKKEEKRQKREKGGGEYGRVKENRE